MEASPRRSPIPPGFMSSQGVCDRIGISYRQLDYLVRKGSVDHIESLRANGSGSRRLWPLSLVDRLEVATVLAAVVPTDWSRIAERLVSPTVDEPPAEGWAIMDDLGDVHYATSTSTLGDVLGRGQGGVVVAYALTRPREAVAA